MATVFSLIAAVGVFLLIANMTGQMQSKANVRSRVRKIADQDQASDQEFERLESFRDEPSPLAQALEKIMQSLRLSSPENSREVQMKFAQAGIRSSNALIFYFFAKKLGWIIGLLVALLLISGNEEGIMLYLIWGMALAAILAGLFGADLFLKNKKEKRQYVLNRSFPDGLDLILVCVEAGLALDAALARVTRELDDAHPELCYEFNKTRMELTLLNDRERALQNLADRTDLLSFRSLTGALLQSERFGTSLIETLRVLSEDYRNTRMMIAENKANRLPALITIPLMLLMMPAFIMILIAPAIIMVMEVW